MRTVTTQLPSLFSCSHILSGVPHIVCFVVYNALLNLNLKVTSVLDIVEQNTIKPSEMCNMLKLWVYIHG